MAYNASLHTTTNKAIGIAQGQPTDARSYFYDEGLFTYRPFNSTAEVLSYLNTPISRTGNFPIYVKAGAIITEWSFKNGTSDSDLVTQQGTATEISPGVVQLATEIEMQLTGTIAEDAKVASRLKIYKWFEWIKTQVHTITAEWKFAFIKLTGDTPVTPAAGHLWQSSGNYKVFKTVAEDIITSASNTALAGSIERVVTATTAGGLSGAYELVEEIVTDVNIIDACNAGTYNSGNGFTSTITPPAGTTFYKGQRCKQALFMYIAFDDNTATRMALG